MEGYKYYFHALAAYKDKECLSILDKLVNQPVDESSQYKDSRKKNLKLIHHALEKHYVRMYDGLMKKIEKLVPGDLSLEIEYPEDSIWNY